MTPGHRFEQSADQWFYVNFLSLGGGLWVWLTIGFVGSVVIVWRTTAAWDRERLPGRLLGWGVGVLAVFLAVASFVQACRVNWDNDKDFARYYLGSTVFYAPSLALGTAPPSLDRLITGAVASPGGRGGCGLTGDADVPG